MLGEWLLIPGHMGLHNSEYLTYTRELEGRAQSMRLCSPRRLLRGIAQCSYTGLFGSSWEC
jgi:hypothetical protein